MKTLILLLVLLFVTFSSLAQELQCEVNVHMEAIPTSQRSYLQTFKDDVERYLNSTRFTSETIEEKIRCSFDIFIKQYTGNNQYLAQVYIASQRPIYRGDEKTDAYTPMLRIMDENWEFIYIPNQRMIQDDFVVDPLCDFLDFYAYIIIGFDYDTYEPLSGSPWFQKAFNICQQLASSQLGRYWQQASSSYNRYTLARELTSTNYEQFRIALNQYYFDGIDKISIEPPSALEAITYSLETIAAFRKLNPNSVVIKQFFDAKYKEIADIFLQYPTRDIYDKLSTIDQEHRATYQEWKNKRRE
ncbi:MAG: DUF4835 family protein [Bacteroidetes bacterium]|nr:DUF4835 family protein [Bacteroidota bacterium]